MDNFQLSIRHPDEFSIEINPLNNPINRSANPSSLELICHYNSPFPTGSMINIRIPSIQPTLSVTGKVFRCIDKHEGYELGITFTTADELMRIRMLEQVCYIRRYRQHILHTEGRTLSEQDAALEWINKYAALFPTDHV